MQNINLLKLKVKITFIVLIASLILFTFITSFENLGFRELIWIEAENSENVLDGFDIIVDHDLSEGKAVKSTSVSHNIQNYGRYPFHVMNSGEFQIWARFYGENSCGNSFYISIDNSTRYLIGNDDMMRTWHWVKGPVLQINKGKHDFFLWNEEKGTTIDKFLLTTNHYYIPAKLGESIDFKVDFEGEIPDFLIFKNNEFWQLNKEELSSGIYLKSGLNTDEYFIINKTIPDIYCFRSEFSTTDNDNFNLIFLYNYGNDNNYHFIELNDSNINVYKKNNNNEILISSSGISFKKYYRRDTNNHIVFICENNKITLKLNGITVKRIKSKTGNNGLIGLGSRKGNVHFDNISLNSNLEPSFECNFFDGMSGNWEIYDGDWSVGQYPFYYLIGKQISDNHAFIINGEEYWKNYCYSVAFNATDQTIGLAFNIQDINNYYLFKWESYENKGNIQLLKIRDGIEKILGEKSKGFTKNNFYNLEVKTLNGNIKTFIDDKIIFNCSDTSFLEGKVGILTNSNSNKNIFDDIEVQPYSGIDTNYHVYYRFFNRLDFTRNLCDWKNAGDFISDESDKIFIQKDLFEEKVIYNKKIFTDEITAKIHIGYFPQDIDFIFLIEDLNQHEVYKLIFKDTELFLKVNDIIIKTKSYSSRKGVFTISFSELKQLLKIEKNEEALIKHQLNEHIGHYKIGIGFGGIGRWNIRFPMMTLKTNDYYIE